MHKGDGDNGACDHIGELAYRLPSVRVFSAASPAARAGLGSVPEDHQGLIRRWLLQADPSRASLGTHPGWDAPVFNPSCSNAGDGAFLLA